MGLLLRLFFMLMFGRRRGALHVLDTCVTPFRVWLNDLDVLRHMTNSRYFAIPDLARVDLMIRSGLWPKLNAQGWYPVVTLETMRFHRSLELGDRYQVATRVIGWDDRQVFLEQGFVRDGVPVATGVVRTRFLKRAGGTVSVAELMELAGVSQASPPLPEWVVQWSDADGGMQTSRSSHEARAATT
jgi:acyl-CoA thioesterase FadM